MSDKLPVTPEKIQALESVGTATKTHLGTAALKEGYEASNDVSERIAKNIREQFAEVFSRQSFNSQG